MLATTAATCGGSSSYFAASAGKSSSEIVPWNVLEGREGAMRGRGTLVSVGV